MLTIQPLRLTADLTVGDATAAYRLRGTMAFARTMTPIVCD